MRRLALSLFAVALLAAAERYRPLVHFSPARNWTNDPCGIVSFDGEYHLFYQFNPFGDRWGHMSWGHAVSPDLVRWTELPVAIPEGDVMIFTGSSVVDWKNTSGFCAGVKPCLVAIYTGHQKGRQTQHLAYSNDRGRTWTKYAGNPVLDENMADFRDPKVFWHAASGRWVMVVALPKEHAVRFYGSADLKRWTRLREFGPAGATGGVWECPDLYQLPVEGGGAKWVLKIGLNPGHVAGGSGEQYFIGEFDGERFRNDNPASRTLWLDYGRDCYCALKYDGGPMIAWMNNWQYAGSLPTAPWRGQMTLPRELALKRFPEGLRLMQRPVDAVRARRGEKLLRPGGDAFDMTAEVRAGSAAEFGWKLMGGAVVGYDVRAGRIYLERPNGAFSEKFGGRAEAPAALENGVLRLRLVADRLSVEVFAQDGKVA